MNDLQRQILADRIDSVLRDIADHNKIIDNLELRLKKKKVSLSKLETELIELKEGIDW